MAMRLALLFFLAVTALAQKKFWAFQPLEPQSGSIDEILKPTGPPVGNAAWMRRVSFSLIGLPPTDLTETARAAYVDNFVRSLPNGYQTTLSDDGGNLSAGEKQLITIARAFVAQPQLLILDEATSSVDTRTELLVQQAMSELRRDRTSFIIAHRLSTIRDADLIVVIEGGRIVEQGSHAELLERGGAYWAMASSA